MAKRMDELSPERRFSEQMGVVGEQIGMPPMVARVLGWLLICDPAQQSMGQIATELGVSRASVSIATRLLEAPGWIRRTPAPGQRGYFFEVAPGAFERIPAADLFSLLRRTLDQGLHMLPEPDGERGARLREARDFYAFVEAEIPRLIDSYRARDREGGAA